MSKSQFWPYDEVQISGDAQDATRFRLSSPWLSLQFKVAAPGNLQVLDLIKKMEAGNISQEDFETASNVFSSLADFPVAYLLPRNGKFGIDQHQVEGKALNLETPQTLFKDVFGDQFSAAQKNLGNWTWDVDQALEFSKAAGGYDPLSLFSVLRRFHLLNDLENNETQRLFDYIESLSSDPAKFKKASALILRQNHYVTVRCEEVLSAALVTAQSADNEIKEFIEAESGHDKIVGKAITSLGHGIEETPVIDVSRMLMDFFKFSGQKNLLAFSAIVDVFERSSYREEDPLTSVLNTGGMSEAGKMVDIHREINDSGDHENAALEFLENMKPVNEAYAREAFRLAELNTLIIHQHSKVLLAQIKSF